MSATVYIDDPIGGEEARIECEEVRIIGELVWATPDGDGQETVVPLGNVTGVKGDVVKQDVEEIESPGGLFTELVTDLS
ncbi:hypothetical protein [Haloparvum sp. PAK95]|uniref:hypothetical protein n=1 Tax=Haloparvum sp. PAK95 TaxID=3418962 RepID=UPI003D2ED15F